MLKFSRCELLLWDTGSWGPGIVRESRGRGTSAVRRRNRTTTSENVSVTTSVCVCVCVCVIIKLWSVVTSFIKESNKSNQSKIRLQSHSYTWDYTKTVNGKLVQKCEYDNLTAMTRKRKKWTSSSLWKTKVFEMGPPLYCIHRWHLTSDIADTSIICWSNRHKCFENSAVLSFKSNQSIRPLLHRAQRKVFSWI
jgi:hypothetical protein